MDKLRGRYNEEFPVGSKVRIKDTEFLVEFQRTWKSHDPLSDKQLRYAGDVATVRSVGFYHGGDELYQLEGIPGIWHEECLTGG